MCIMLCYKSSGYSCWIIINIYIFLVEDEYTKIFFCMFSVRLFFLGFLVILSLYWVSFCLLRYKNKTKKIVTLQFSCYLKVEGKIDVPISTIWITSREVDMHFLEHLLRLLWFILKETSLSCHKCGPLCHHNKRGAGPSRVGTDNIRHSCWLASQRSVPVSPCHTNQHLPLVSKRSAQWGEQPR